MKTEIDPKRVRYIKLGREGSWESDCREQGIVRFGFGSAKNDRFKMCRTGNWDQLTESFLSEGKDQKTATRFTRETRLFFEDDGTTLWITFMDDKLYWGFLSQEPAERYPAGEGVFRRVVNGWRCTDINDKQLTMSCLSGALTKLAAYRGTSCNVDVAEYVKRRINGRVREEVEVAISALRNLESAVVAMMKHLTPKDFELLVDLVFAASGWRREGMVGGTQKTLDLDLTLPTTGEKAFVQIKSRTDQNNLDNYVELLAQMDSYDRMFFVYHTGQARSDDKQRVTVIGPERLAEMVVEAGLVSWLINKAA